jgi:hypothetical protein
MGSDLTSCQRQSGATSHQRPKILCGSILMAGFFPKPVDATECILKIGELGLCCRYNTRDLRNVSLEMERGIALLQVAP